MYEPKIPIVDKPTELKFTVQRISTGDYVKDLEANVLVTDNISGKFRNFKFNNVSAPDGQFSVKYLFSLLLAHEYYSEQICIHYGS
jgi:hypothetical protein